MRFRTRGGHRSDAGLAEPPQAEPLPDAEVTTRRADCTSELMEVFDKVQVSGAFDALEKLRFFGVVRSLKASSERECAICLEPCSMTSPVHGHGNTCLECMRKFADAEVERGRIPSCPTCRAALSVADIDGLGVQERTARFARRFARERGTGRLMTILRNNRSVLGSEEVSKLQALLDVTQDMWYDPASEEYIRNHTVACPRCSAPCQRVTGCPSVLCRCGERFQIQQRVPDLNSRSPQQWLESWRVFNLFVDGF